MFSPSLSLSPSHYCITPLPSLYMPLTLAEPKLYQVSTNVYAYFDKKKNTWIYLILLFFYPSYIYKCLIDQCLKCTNLEIKMKNYLL